MEIPIELRWCNFTEMLVHTVRIYDIYQWEKAQAIFFIKKSGYEEIRQENNVSESYMKEKLDMKSCVLNGLRLEDFFLEIHFCSFVIYNAYWPAYHWLIFLKSHLSEKGRCNLILPHLTEKLLGRVSDEDIIFHIWKRIARTDITCFIRKLENNLLYKAISFVELALEPC